MIQSKEVKEVQTDFNEEYASLILKEIYSIGASIDRATLNKNK